MGWVGGGPTNYLVYPKLKLRLRLWLGCDKNIQGPPYPPHYAIFSKNFIGFQNVFIPTIIYLNLKIPPNILTTLHTLQIYKEQKSLIKRFKQKILCVHIWKKYWMPIESILSKSILSKSFLAAWFPIFRCGSWLPTGKSGSHITRLLRSPSYNLH